jgi:L-fucono-1,5-lactonase
VSQQAVDGHQHFWSGSLPWMRAEHAAIARSFTPEDLRPLLDAEGIAQTIVVQAACDDQDTDSMFEHAARHDWIAAVVAWAPLLEPDRARARLDELSSRPKLRGIRHLIHDEEDPHWILQPAVLESLALLEERGLVLELPVVWPRHLRDVPTLATSFPRLTIVVDHLGKPPIGTDLSEWGDSLRAAAAHANVAAKISGLNTATDRPDWSAEDLRPSVEIALDAFGPDRLLWGSDWPVALLNGDYHRVWGETRRVLETIAPKDVETLLGGTARRLYRLSDPTL